MVQRFRIELVFPHPPSLLPRHLLGSATTDFERQMVLRLSSYCDRLHSLIGKLRLMRWPIAHMEIVIQFSNLHAKFPTFAQAFSAVQSLLNPFRRLCQVTNSQVLSIMINSFSDRKVDILLPGHMSSGSSKTLVKFLEHWSKDLSSSQPSFQLVQVLEAYWRVENLVSIIKGRYSAEPKFVQFEQLLETARIAREGNNHAILEKVWDRVVAIWFEYLDDQAVFQSHMMQLILMTLDS